MRTNLGLEVMDSINPQLNWKIVTKGRRSRMSVGRRKLGNVLLRSPSPQPRNPVYRQESFSQPYSSSPLFEECSAYPSHFSVLRSGSSFSSWKLRDGLATHKFGEGFGYEILSEQTGEERNYVGDFSGIELLAAAATMDDDANEAGKEDPVVEYSFGAKRSDTSYLATQFEQDSEPNKSLNNETVRGGDSGSLVWDNSGFAAQTTTRTDPFKVDRRHWDLNTLMDAWDEPYGETVTRKPSKDVAIDDTHVEGRLDSPENQLICNPAVTEDKFSDLKLEGKKSIEVSTGGTCTESPSPEGTLREPANICFSNVTIKTCDQAFGNIDSPTAYREKIDSFTIAAKTTSHIALVESTDVFSSAAKKVILHTASVEKVDLDAASAEKIDSTVDVRHYSDLCLDNNGHVVASDDLTMLQEGHDSPYEDGELRGSYLYPWEENKLESKHVDYGSVGRHGDGSDTGDLPESEIVDGSSEGSHSSLRKSLLTKRFQGSNESNSISVQGTFMHFMEDESENNDVGGKNESDLVLVMGENDDEVKRRFSDQMDSIDDTVGHMDKYVLRTIQGKFQSCSKGRSSLDAFNGKDIFFMQQCRSRQLGGSDSRSERDKDPHKHLSKYKNATHGSENVEADQWTYWGSRSRYASSYSVVGGRSFNKQKRVGDSADKFDRLDFDHKRQNTTYLSKGGLRSPLVRSNLDRDDCFGAHRRMTRTQDINENYPQGGKKFELVPDNTSKSVRLSPYLSSRERSFSPCSVRDVHVPLTHRRSRSRSRTRSPVALHSIRGRELGTRRLVRSPYFKPDSRMDRMKLPHSNSTFASDYRESYMSPPKARFSPQCSGRWFDDLKFSDNHVRHRRSPVRLFRRSQRFDAIGSSGQQKSDGYFKHTIRRGRFSFFANDDPQGKFATDYEHRRRGDRSEVMPQRRDADYGNSRRFQQSAEADLEIKKLGCQG